MRHAIRHAVFVKAPIPYAITYDDVEKDGVEHRFELLIHVPSADDGAAPGSPLVIGTHSGEPAGQASLLHPGDARVTKEPYETQRMPGGPYNKHEVLRFETRAVNPHFVQLLVPTSDIDVRAEVRRDASEVAVRLHWPYGLDEITFCHSRDGESLQLPRLSRRSHPAPDR